MVLGTTKREIAECLSMCGGTLIVAGVGMFSCVMIFGYYMVKRMCLPAGRSVIMRVLLAIALALPYVGVVKLYRLMGNERTCLEGFKAVYFLYDSMVMARKCVEYNNVRKNEWVSSHPVKVDSAVLQSNPVYVFGIGESLTRNHMSLYGYKRETTPLLDAMKEKLVICSDCIARYYDTNRSVALTYIHYNDAGLPDYTLPQVIRAAGYDCVRISMQISLSKQSLVDSVLFYDIESQGHNTRDGQRFDDELLPLLNQVLHERRDRPVVIFLHFLGSHFEYIQRYPKEAAVWADDCCEEVDVSKVASLADCNRYDNSVRFTDKVVAKVIQMLEAAGRPSFFAFLSDHGETPCAKYARQRHLRDMWEVPLFFWFSQEYCARYPALVQSAKDHCLMPLQSTELFGCYLSLLHIEGCSVKSCFEKDYVQQTRRIVDDANFEYDTLTR